MKKILQALLNFAATWLSDWFENQTNKPPKYSVPAEPPKGKSFSKDIRHAHPYLQERWPQLKAKFEKQNPGYRLKLMFVWRSSEYQARLYKQGRRGIKNEQIITYADGIKKRSKHNYWPARAFDVFIYDKEKGKAIWDQPEYAKLTPIAKELGLVHGMTWKRFVDPQHMQCPKNIK